MYIQVLIILQVAQVDCIAHLYFHFYRTTQKTLKACDDYMYWLLD